jgi:hypothetical protein
MKVWLVIVILTAGCWTNAAPARAPEPPPPEGPVASPRHSPPPRDDFDLAMDKMVEFRDEMCACSDVACAQQVADEMTKWAQEEAKLVDAVGGQMTEERTKRATAIGEEMGNCMQKAMAGPAPPPPLPPPSPGP